LTARSTTHAERNNCTNGVAGQLMHALQLRRLFHTAPDAAILRSHSTLTTVAHPLPTTVSAAITNPPHSSITPAPTALDPTHPASIPEQPYFGTQTDLDGNPRSSRYSGLVLTIPGPGSVILRLAPAYSLPKDALRLCDRTRQENNWQEWIAAPIHNSCRPDDADPFHGPSA